MASPSNSERAQVGVDLPEVLTTVRRALAARYGAEVGAEAAADVARWAVEHADRLDGMRNPAGYLFRVGQTAAGRLLRWHRRHVTFPTEPRWDDDPHLGGDVFEALKKLSLDQRTAVLMVHGYGFSYAATASVMGKSEAAVTNYLHRGLAKLRTLLEDQT